MGVQNNISAIKIGIIYTVSNLVVRGMAFLTTPIFTRLMTKTEYGQFSSISSWANILLTVVTLDLYSAVSVARYDYNENINEYLSSSLLLGNIATLAFYGVIEFNMSWAEQIFKMDRSYIRIIFIYMLFYPAVQLLLAKYRMYNEYKNVIVITWINLLVSTASQIILVIVFSDKLLGRVLGNYAVVSLVNVVCWAIIVYKGKSFSSKYCRHALKLAVPLIPHTLSGVLLVSSDRLMINSICGSEDAALYSLAYTISMVASVLHSSLNQAWIPWMYDRMESDRNAIHKASKLYTVLIVGCCIGIMLFGPEAVLIFGGKSYYSARYTIAPVIFALFLQYVYTQYANIEFYRKKNLWISTATMMATGINIGLNYLLLPRLGYQVAAYTTLAGFFFMVVLHYCIAKKITDDADIYSGKTFVLGILMVFLTMLVALVSYRYNWLRMLFIIIYFAVILGFLYRNRSKVGSLLKRTFIP